MRKLFYLPIVFLLIITKDCWCQQLPIKPARTISFTTDEGSYMNVDVSPDGKTLAFDLLGDLYTVPSTGGTATQLTRGLALNLRPIWSPDGKRLAYNSDLSGSFHLNVRDVTGSFHRVLGQSDEEVSYGQNAIWLPGGNYVAIGKYVYGLVGGKISPTTKGRLLQFSPDGNIAYYMDEDTLVRYDCVNKIRQVISTMIRKSRSGNLSPDGRWWVYVADSNAKRCLMAKDLANNVEKMIVASLFKTSSYRPLMPNGHYAFAPDSKYLFIAYGGKIHRISLNDGKDHVIPFLAHVQSDLGPLNYHTFRVNHDPVKVRYIRSANVSPDGKRLVFSALNKLYVMALPRGKANILVDQPVSQYQPIYSPDGQWIAYVSWCDTVGGYLWRVPAVGGKPEQLTSVRGHYQRPTWSPDGKCIAVVVGKPELGDRDDPGIGKLILIPMNGGQVITLDEQVPLWNQLSFSNDGRRIFYQPKFMRTEDKRIVQLISKDLLGGNLQILAIGAEHRYLQQRSLSPDGRFMVYSGAEDLYLESVASLAASQLLYDKGMVLPVIRFAAGVDPYWEKGGKVLCWNYGNRFYRINPDKILATAEKLAQKKDSARLPDEPGFLVATVVPDQVVDLDVTVPASYARGTVVLRDVRIITMQGNKVIEQGTIIIRDGRISDVGTMASVAIPKGAKLLDLPGTTVMPGLVDLHLHSRVPPDIFPQQSWMFLTSLAYGVTTARDPSLNFDSYGYKELLETGQMIGPRLYTVGRAVRMPDMMLRFDNLDDAQVIVRKRALLGGIVVKQYALPTRLQRQWLLLACRQQGLNMTNEGLEDPIGFMGMVKDGSTGVEHNPVWGEVYKDVITFMAASRCYLTPALQACYGAEYAREYFDHMYWRQPDSKMRRFIDSAYALTGILHVKPTDTVRPAFLLPAYIDARIRQQGGRIGLGSHGNDKGIGPHNELWALQMGGLSNWEVLQAATIVGAAALGIQQDIGSLEPGKIADLLILNMNPLDDIHNSREIRYVMKDGILYDGNTLDVIWPVAENCPEWKLKER